LEGDKGRLWSKIEEGRAYGRGVFLINRKRKNKGFY
jgi:hypothetical protein